MNLEKNSFKNFVKWNHFVENLKKILIIDLAKYKKEFYKDFWLLIILKGLEILQIINRVVLQRIINLKILNQKSFNQKVFKNLLINSNK